MIVLFLILCFILVLPIVFRHQLMYITIGFALISLVLLLIFHVDAVMVVLLIGFYLLGAVVALTMPSDKAAIKEILDMYKRPTDVEDIDQSEQKKGS